MSSLRSRFARFSLALLLPALAAPPAFGLAQRAFVASYGSDPAPCSLVSPCRGFNAAIAQVVSGGEVIVLDSAGYGTTTITQSVSIIAPAGVYAGVSVVSGDGITINAPGIKVVLQNIAINGLGGGYGVFLQQAAEVDINNCTVSNFVTAGIFSNAANAKLNVRNTLVRDNSGPGIWLGGSTLAVLEQVHVVRNGSDGIRLQVGAAASVKRSVLAGNAGEGLAALPGAGNVVEATVEDSLVADNGDVGLALSATAAGGVAEISAVRNTITRNHANGIFVVAGAGSSIASLSDNLITQNGNGGVGALGANAVVTANNNTFARNTTSAMATGSGATIHTVKGADGLPNNSGEETTPTSGNVVPANAF